MAVSYWAFLPCENLTTVYYAGTEAEWNELRSNIAYGNSDLINAEIIFLGESEEPDTVPGDLSGDGEVNAKDSNLFKRVLAGEATVEEGSAEFSAIDLNSDGDLNAKDSNILKRIIAGATRM